MKFWPGRQKNRVVFGVSSVGKSWFIQRLLKNGNIPAKMRIIMASELIDQADLMGLGPCLIHYNALRPFNNDINNFPGPVERDEVATSLFNRKQISIVDILVARRSTIAKRMLLRDTIEFDLRSDESQYPTAQLYEFISRTDLLDIYEPWIAFFKERNIAFRFVSAEENSCGELLSEEKAREVLGSTEPESYSSKEHARIFEKFTFPYQGRDGVNCGPSLATIRPYLEGNSLLDVGCAEGAFCFASEKLGFDEVVGIELKRDRFLAACVHRDVSGSQCIFRIQDVFALPQNESFDVVLLLNVLHHLQNPISALIHLANKCNRRLILEYPTLNDQKFTATIQRPIDDLNALPLIGVSLLASQDQTFLFTDLAIQRICVDNLKIFREVEFLPSPRARGRSIAICTV